MARLIINDEFVEDDTHRGESPAWQDPTGNSVDKPKIHSSLNYIDEKKAARMHIRYSYDFEKRTKPMNIKKKFFVVTGEVGFLTEELILKLPFNAVPVPRIEMKLKEGKSIDRQANVHIRVECNAYAKEYIENDNKDIRVADRWLLNSIVEAPEQPCFWEIATMNPMFYIILYNNNTNEIIKNLRPRWIKKYNEIVESKKDVNKRLYTELEIKYKKENQLRLLNFAYEYIGNARKDCYALNCEGLTEEQILNYIYKFINGCPGMSKEGR